MLNYDYRANFSDLQLSGTSDVCLKPFHEKDWNIFVLPLKAIQTKTNHAQIFCNTWWTRFFIIRWRFCGL